MSVNYLLSERWQWDLNLLFKIVIGQKIKQSDSYIY